MIDEIRLPLSPALNTPANLLASRSQKACLSGEAEPDDQSPTAP